MMLKGVSGFLLAEKKGCGVQRDFRRNWEPPWILDGLRTANTHSLLSFPFFIFLENFFHLTFLYRTCCENRGRNPSWKQQVWRQMIIFALYWDLKSNVGSSGSPSFHKFQEHLKTPAMKMLFTLNWLNLGASYEHRLTHFLVLVKSFSF